MHKRNDFLERIIVIGILTFAVIGFWSVLIFTFNEMVKVYNAEPIRELTQYEQLYIAKTN